MCVCLCFCERFDERKCLHYLREEAVIGKTTGKILFEASSFFFAALPISL